MSSPIQHLAAAPHRAFFFLGALQSLIAMLWWSLELGGRLGLTMPPTPLWTTAFSPAAAHAWSLLYGLFPAFIFGFIFTAGPNWLNAPAIARRHYLGAAIGLGLGGLLFYPALYWPALRLPALLLHAAGWAVALIALHGMLRGAEASDKQHARLASLALLLGGVGALAFLFGVATDQADATRLAEILAVWGCLVPLFLVVCHRMLPWFTSRVVANYVLIRPYRPLYLMLAASLLHGALDFGGRSDLTWLADLPLLGFTIWFSARWGIARSFGVPLLAMLHIAFVWAAVAFALYALASLLAWLDIATALGDAPLHALGIGFFASMLIGMASRVSLGHSGRKLEADRLTRALFWLIQAVAVVRIAPDLAPEFIPYPAVAVSALLWLLVFGLWAGRYAPFYWRPRVDGKPG